jgi:hypothetical protein
MIRLFGRAGGAGVLIWINGPFGVGKTQTAWELQRRLPGSAVSDPEVLGFALRRMLPCERDVDFQDIPLWRAFVCRTLARAETAQAGPLIVPMTVVAEPYFAETVLALRDDGVDVRHFSLLASREQVLRRLRRRGDFKRSWPAQQLDRCLEALASPRFADHLDTADLGVEDVAEAIAGRVGLAMLPRESSSMRRSLNRLKVQLQHVRIGRP